MSISIHALREEGDRRLGAAAQVGEGISIHALREEGDRKSDFYTAPASTFLSTPSARRATCPLPTTTRSARFLSTPSARRATWLHIRQAGIRLFLSTPSARRATAEPRGVPRRKGISIHALREEGDELRHSAQARHPNFYPRPPRGGRQSTFHASIILLLISIHALREEGDAVALKAVADGNKFLSTPSARRATKIRAWKAGDDEFLSTPSARRATTEEEMNEIFGGFLSTPSARRATPQYIVVHSAKLFLSTPSARRATPQRRTSSAVPAYFYPRPPRGGRRRSSA